MPIVGKYIPGRGKEEGREGRKRRGEKRRAEIEKDTER